MVVRAIDPHFQNLVLNGFRVVALAAEGDAETVRTVASDDYIPDVELDNSQNDGFLWRWWGEAFVCPHSFLRRGSKRGYIDVSFLADFWGLRCVIH